jgi:hypothetical protein
VILGSGEARAQVEWNNTFVTESLIDAIPIDLEVTPNGKVAVVRGNLPGNDFYNSQKVTFWRTDTGAPITVTGTPPGVQGNLPWVASSGKPLFSDALAVTNDVAVAIGSAAVGHSSENTTYVEVYQITYPSGLPQVSFASTHTLGGGTNLSTMAGSAHDVAITPNGSLAVVNHSNWIHVLDLANGGLYRSLNIGGAGSPGNKGPCSPVNIRNSVAVTDSSAVVTTGRGLLAQRKAWVYLIDLTSQNGAVAEFPLTASGANEHPHDVAISPNGQLAVVSANAVVGLYDLVNRTPVGNTLSDSQDRHWNYPAAPGHFVPDLWDSVEMSNDHAVVIGNQIVYDPQSQSNFYYWASYVIDISQTGYTAHLPAVNGWAGVFNNDTAWDLALSSDGRVATVKTWLHDVALLDVVNNPTSAFVSGSLSGASYPQSSGGYGINDATAILAPKRVGTSLQRWAVFAGRDPADPNGLARLHFYDLAASSWPVGGGSVVIRTMAEPNPSQDFIAPADLELSPGGTEVIARLTETLDDSGQVGGKDWSAWGGAPPVQAGYSIGARGLCIGADSLRMGTRWAVSTSRDQITTNTRGWIHIVRNTHESQYP